MEMVVIRTVKQTYARNIKGSETGMLCTFFIHTHNHNIMKNTEEKRK